MTTTAPRSLKSRALQLLAQREQSRVELRRKLLAHARACATNATAPPARPVATDATPDTPDTPDSHETHETHETLVAPKTPGSPGTPGPRLTSATRRTPGAPETRRTSKATHDAAGSLRPLPTATSDASPECRVDEVIAWLDAHCLLSDDRFTESRINARVARYGDVRIRQELKQHGIALPAEAARTLRDSEASRAWAVWERRFGTAPEAAAERARHARFLVARGFSSETVRLVLKRALASVGRRSAAAPDDDNDDD